MSLRVINAALNAGSISRQVPCKSSAVVDRSSSCHPGTNIPLSWSESPAPAACITHSADIGIAGEVAAGLQYFGERLAAGVKFFFDPNVRSMP